MWVVSGVRVRVWGVVWVRFRVCAAEPLRYLVGLDGVGFGDGERGDILHEAVGWVGALCVVSLVGVVGKDECTVKKSKPLRKLSGV